MDANIFFLLNQDAFVDSNTIRGLAEAFTGTEEYGILSPIHYNGNGSAFDHGFKQYISPTIAAGLKAELVEGRYSQRTYDVDFVNAACWMLSRRCIEMVGLFNPMFFHYAEDNNYVHRLNYHGLKLGIVARSRICHDRRPGKLINSKEHTAALFKRLALLELSRPDSVMTLGKMASSYCRQLASHLLHLRSEKVKQNFNRLWLIFSLDQMEIMKAKKESLATGFAFWNETPGFY